MARGSVCNAECVGTGNSPAAVSGCGSTHEITRIESLGENIHLDPINLHPLYSSAELLSFFMGKNTPERHEFISEYLGVEKDPVEV